MEELDYAELFGVSENETGAEEPEVTDPAEEDQDTGAEEPEVTDPASDDENDNDTSEDAQPGKPGRTEDDARYAAARRRAEAERDAAVERARQEERAKASELLKRLGIKNPSKPGSSIESLEDLEAYEQTLNARRFTQKMRRGEITPEEIAQSVLQSDAMKPLQEIRQQMEKDRQTREQAEIRSRIESDVRTIAGMDPDVKSLEDIMGQAEYPQILEHVKRGESLVDAYRLVHFDKLSGRKADRAQQAARNAAAGKAHLRATNSRGTGGVEVTPEEIAQYRTFLPNATAEEIRAFKAKDAKRK